jgi:predicted site-specific integrase-resolvase
MSQVAANNESDLMSLRTWLDGLGVSDTTGWRWRKEGVIKTVNIYGRQYVTRQARAEFLARAESGEFSQAPVVPKAK